MNETSISRQRNRNTEASFCRQVRLQIYLPLGIGLLLLISLAVGLGTTGVGGTSNWGNISLIFVILPLLILGLVAFAIVAVLIYAIGRAMQGIRGVSYGVQQKVAEIATIIQQGSDRLVYPIISIRSFWWASCEALSGIASIFRGRQGKADEPR